MKKYYYIYNLSMQYNNGPSVKHGSFEDAFAEARRLASKHPNQEIEILQAVAILKTEITEPKATLLD